MRQLIFGIALTLACYVANADELSDIQEQSNLLDAKLTLIKKQREYAKEQTGASTDSIDAIKTAVNARNSLKQAEVSNDLATVTALKAALGEPPDVGKSGLVTFKTGTDGVPLLRAREQSLTAVSVVANEICKQLPGKSSDIVIVPSNIETMIQKANWTKAKIDAMNALANQYKTDAQSPIKTAFVVTPAAIIGAVTAAQYVIGGAEKLSRVARGDKEIGVVAADRNELFEATLAANCSTHIKGAFLEQSLIANSKANLDLFGEMIKNMREFVANVDLKKGNIVQAIFVDEKALETAQADAAKNPKNKELKAKADFQKAKLKSLKEEKADFLKVEAASSTVAAFLESLKGQEDAFIEASVWADANNSPLLSNKDKLKYSFAAQDMQVVEDRAFTGKQVGRSSTVEVTFRLETANSASIIAAGYASSTIGQEKLDFRKSETILPSSSGTSKSAN